MAEELIDLNRLKKKTPSLNQKLLLSLFKEALQDYKLSFPSKSITEVIKQVTLKYDEIISPSLDKKYKLK